MTPDAVRAAVAAYYAAVSDRDVAAAVAMFTPDAKMLDPVGAPPALDAEQRRQRYAGIAATFDTFSIETSFVAVCAAAEGGADAAARWTAAGVAKNGKHVAFDGISTFTFDPTGKIAAMSAYWEPAAVLAAMQP
jgi:steroid delta-isomerase